MQNILNLCEYYFPKVGQLSTFILNWAWNRASSQSSLVKYEANKNQSRGKIAVIKCSLIALSIYGNDFLQISGQVSAENMSLGSVSPELKCGSSREIMMGEGNKQPAIMSGGVGISGRELYKYR